MQVPELCREHGMSSATFYKWRAKFVGMDASLTCLMKSIEDENRRLKKMFAELSMQNEVLKEALEKIDRPSQRRGVSIVLACRTFGVSKTCNRYSPKLSDENEQIADLLVGLTAAEDLGVWAMFSVSAQRAGHGWNHKRVYRIYRELNLRIKPRKQMKRDKPDSLMVPTGPNMTLSMDFMADRLRDGWTFMLFNVLDDFNREGLGIEVDSS